MGLYPPPGSKRNNQHGNRTSREITSVMKNNHFAWNDLFPIAPGSDETCANLNSCGMLNELESRIVERTHEAHAFVESWHARLVDFVKSQRKVGNKPPVVIWVGRIANKALKWLVDLKSVQTTEKFGTPWYDVRFNTELSVLSLEGAVHPSAFLQAHGGSTFSRHRFNDTFAFAEVLRKNADQGFSDAFAQMAEDAQSRTNLMVSALDSLGVPHLNGFLAFEHRRIRLVNWPNTQIVDELKVLRDAFGYGFLDFLSSLPACRVVPAYVRSMVEWHVLLGTKFATMMCDGVAARFVDDAFNARMVEWHGLLGTKFATMMCDSVAARFVDDAFNARMVEWHGLLGTKFTPFLVGGIAARTHLIPIEMIRFVASNNWVQAMSQEFARRVDYRRLLPMVAESVWLNVFEVYARPPPPPPPPLPPPPPPAARAAKRKRKD